MEKSYVLLNKRQKHQENASNSQNEKYSKETVETLKQFGFSDEFLVGQAKPQLKGVFFFFFFFLIVKNLLIYSVLWRESCYFLD